MYST